MSHKQPAASVVERKAVEPVYRVQVTVENAATDQDVVLHDAGHQHLSSRPRLCRHFFSAEGDGADIGEAFLGGFVDCCTSSGHGYLLGRMRGPFYLLSQNEHRELA